MNTVAQFISSNTESKYLFSESVNYAVEAVVSFAQSYPDCEELKTMIEALQQFGASPAERIEDNLDGLVKQVDMKMKTNTFQHLLEQMAAAGDESVLKNLLEKKLAGRAGKWGLNHAELVDFLPVIGEILLDDFRMMKFENYEHLHENIKNVLHAFRDDANFMIVCLVQWMCSQSVTNPCQSLKLLTIFLSPKHSFKSSDAEMLKQAFTYTQACGSPSVLQLVDRCNKAGVVENWCMVWLNAMLKLSTSDEMLYTSELCLAAGIMSPVPYMLSFARSINEYIFEQNLDFEPKALVSARFLVHCLQLAMHAYWKQQKERQTRIVRGDCAGRKRSCDDDETDQANPVKRSVLVIFEKFVRETKVVGLKSHIYHFVVSLATALQNAATRRIIELLLHDLLKFACLDPQTFNLDLYLPFINLCDVTSTKRALEFTCLLRKLGGF
ncbi:unnamed protein product [Brugia pahangi]|uniref:Mediator complex subunit 24 n=1 Tax=Brugia pahangi TaxID=6280 RepID=A0A0N4TZJ2_BRUPA|nr:unnamed protein product [Brugia pahangi]